MAKARFEYVVRSHGEEELKIRESALRGCAQIHLTSPDGGMTIDRAEWLGMQAAVERALQESEVAPGGDPE